MSDEDARHQALVQLRRDLHRIAMQVAQAQGPHLVAWE
jgi:hypothetical protein